MKLDYSQNPEWLLELAKAIPGTNFPPELCQSVACLTETGELLAVAAFYGFGPGNCEWSLAILSPSVFSPGMLRGVLAFPFKHCGLRRLTAIVHPANAKSQQMLHRLNFKLEGLCRDWFAEDVPGLLFGLTRSDCKWL